MASNSDDYVSPYQVTDRIRRSVLAAQLPGKSINYAHQQDARRSENSQRPAFQPVFDGEAFSGALGTISVVLEGLCLQGAEGWDERVSLVRGKPRPGVKVARVPRVLLGSDRAVCGLFFYFSFSVCDTEGGLGCGILVLREGGAFLQITFASRLEY